MKQRDRLLNNKRSISNRFDENVSLSLCNVRDDARGRDLPAIDGSVLFLSVVFVLVHLITDLAYAKADPRVAYR